MACFAGHCELGIQTGSVVLHVLIGEVRATSEDICLAQSSGYLPR